MWLLALSLSSAACADTIEQEIARSALSSKTTERVCGLVIRYSPFVWPAKLALCINDKLCYGVPIFPHVDREIMATLVEIEKARLRNNSQMNTLLY